MRILAVLTHTPASGASIAERAGLGYKQTIDALVILFNMDRVERVGQKYTAKWCKPRPVLQGVRLRDPFLDIPALRARATESQRRILPFRMAMTRH